jgi:hypothetical protein
MKLKTFEQFIFESDLKEQNDFNKIYIALDDDDLQGDDFSYKKFCSSNFFVPLTKSTTEINVDMPILNYSNDTINHFWDKIKRDNIYNLPKYSEEVSKKERFHQIVGQHENVPLSVFTRDHALKYLNFPVIAKPSDNHSGLGIQVFKKAEELQDSGEDFAVYSEFVDKKEEHRFMIFCGQLMAWMQRKPINKKAQTGEGDKDSEMDFAYEYKTTDQLPSEYVTVVKKFVELFPDLPYMTLDVMKGKDDKVYVIEINSKAGMPFDITVKLYKNIFEDFYGRKIEPESEKNLEMISTELKQKTLEKEKGKFTIKNNEI